MLRGSLAPVSILIASGALGASPVKRRRSHATIPFIHMRAASAAHAPEDGERAASFSLRGRQRRTSAKVAAALTGGADEEEVQDVEEHTANRKRRTKRCGGKRGVSGGGAGGLRLAMHADEEAEQV
jgi:hypothetical protein